MTPRETLLNCVSVLRCLAHPSLLSVSVRVLQSESAASVLLSSFVATRICAGARAQQRRTAASTSLLFALFYRESAKRMMTLRRRLSAACICKQRLQHKPTAYDDLAA